MRNPLRTSTHIPKAQICWTKPVSDKKIKGMRNKKLYQRDNIGKIKLQRNSKGIN